MFGNQEAEEYGYYFDAKSEIPQKDFETTEVKLYELLQNPKDLFEYLVVDQKQKISNHFENRNLLMDKNKFLGMGNDGFVVSLDDPSLGLTCIKYIWKTLDVYPGPDWNIEDLPPDIHTLQLISERFKQIRTITRENLIQTGQASIPTNDPEREAVFQEASRKILLDENQNCYIPEVLQVTSFEDIEDATEDDPRPFYFLNEEYTAITMEHIRGLSIQDIILNFPETYEYLEFIDVDQMEKDIIRAIKSLHEHKIRHQDITIRNIMFDFVQKRPVIIDFGKASYGMSDVAEEDEIKNVKEVMNHLRSFLHNPLSKKESLEEEFRKKSLKFGI
jgi:serine/threonine protein kinase